jgi:phosphoglycolate phosphatase
MTRAFQDVFGIADAAGPFSMAGRTDAFIVAAMAARLGVRLDGADVARFREVYVERLAEEIHKPGPRKGIMPGVRTLLDALRPREDTGVALLTGNFEVGARVKLEYFELWHYFAFGAFGDVTHDRNHLLPAALQQAEASGMRVPPPSDVVIVGDTPLDVEVARAGGARAVAVATGDYDADALRASGAHTVLHDLSDLQAALAALGV